MSAQPSPPPSHTEPPVNSSQRGRLITPGSGLLIVLLCIGGAVWGAYRFMENAPAEALQPVHRWYICAETGKPFEHTLNKGDKSSPVMSPHSQKMTGYPAEACYCSKSADGKPAPTYVLMNTYVGKPEPTNCPKCGTVVVMHNPIKGASTNIESPASAPSSDTATP